MLQRWCITSNMTIVSCCMHRRFLTRCLLPADASLMPKRKACWASWNFIGPRQGVDSTAVCVSYWVNNLQSLPAGAPDLFVTLNPPKPPQEGTILHQAAMAHPEFGFASWRAQDQIAAMQGSKGCIYYAGAWCGYGFHEDGMRSAVAVMKALQLPLPWVPRATSPHVSLPEAYMQRAVCTAARASLAQGRLNMIFPSGAEESFGAVQDEESIALRVAPAVLSASAPAGGTSATAIHMDLSTERAAADGNDGWLAPGPTTQSAAACVRVLHNAAFGSIVQHGVPGLVHAFAHRHFEANDLGAVCHILASNASGIVSCTARLGLLHWLGAKHRLAKHHAARAKLQNDGVCVEVLVDQIGASAVSRIIKGHH